MEWERTLAAAKQEGTVVVGGPAGANFREALLAFQQAYPDIAVQFSGQSGRDFGPKVLAERQAGQFLWDVHIGGVATVVTQFLPEEAVDPLRPSLIRPERWDDSKWFNGFDWGFMDRERKRVLATIASVNRSITVNRDLVAEGDLTKPQDLLDPKHRGRIAWNEPRDTGVGATDAAVLMQALGEEGLRRLFIDQQVVVTRDTRQLAEWLIRGRYPVGIGVRESDLLEFSKEGVGLNVVQLDIPEASTIAFGSAGCVCVMNRAPHPNAAKVYIDWFLSQEGQAILSKTTGVNSRRLDVEPADPSTMPRPGVNYVILQREESNEVVLRAIELARVSLH